MVSKRTKNVSKSKSSRPTQEKDARFDPFGAGFSDDESGMNDSQSDFSEDEREAQELMSKQSSRFQRGDDSDDESDDAESAHSEDDEEDDTEERSSNDDDEQDTNEITDADENADTFLSNPQKKVVKPLSLSSIKKFQDKLDKTGILYLSRVPPFMKPQKLRSLLSKYGEIGRVYLAPEDPRIAAKRKKYKHNKRQNYTEGWVEFLNKDIAKRVANTLNNTNIGGKKSSRYYDDMWNIKYLPRFKWIHLTEQLAYELKVREQKIKTEMAQAKRENKVYLKNVEKAKMIEAIQMKKMAKRKAADMENSGASSGTLADDVIRIKRAYKQRKVVDSENKPKSIPSSSKLSVLSKIFT